MPRPTVSEIRNSFRSMRESVGQGIDAMRPSDYTDLPDEALEELGDIWTTAETAWTWPTHYMLVLVHLAREPQGGAVLSSVTTWRCGPETRCGGRCEIHGLNLGANGGTRQSKAALPSKRHLGGCSVMKSTKPWGGP